MSVLAQGTQIFFLDPEANEIVTVECATTLSPGGQPADQIEDTCLEATTRTYKRGLRTPGQAAMTINADPRNPSHIRLHELSESDTFDEIEWFVGWSDGTEPPTYDSETDTLTLPESRTWFTFRGYVSDFPLDFSANSVVTTAATIQRSGGSAWIPKVVTP